MTKRNYAGERLQLFVLALFMFSVLVLGIALLTISPWLNGAT